MREAFGTTWTFQLIIVFILIFACFLSLVISYSRAYAIKNEMLTMIEKYEGISITNNPEDLTSAEIINNYLRESGYKTKGKCPEGWYGVNSLDENNSNQKSNYTLVSNSNNNTYYYCFKEDKINTADNSVRNKYYKVTLFYHFNLPVIGDLVTFKVNGRTDAFVGSNNRITNQQN